MKFLLCLFALLGAASAFLPNKQYYYYYTAETSVGVPEIAPHYSIVGLRSNISIQVVGQDKMIIQLMNLEVNTDLTSVRGGMNGRPVSQNYQRISGEGKSLEEPFEVFYKRETGLLMTVPKTDKEWLSNIRKSIANIIRVYPIIEIPSMKLSDKRIYREFHSQENTLFGRCDCTYTVNSISHQYLPMPNNVASPSVGHGYDLCQEGAFNVSRAINFDNCQDKNMFQYAGLSNRTNAAKMKFGTMESRSSISHYTICGPEGNRQIQNMTNMGLFNANPFGYDTEKMQAMSNQTFRLSYVRALDKPMQLGSTQDIKSWIMSVASPYRKSSVVTERPWVNFYNNDEAYHPFIAEASVTGDLGDRKRKEMMKFVLGNIQAVAKILHEHPEPSPNGNRDQIFDTDEAEVPIIMNSVSRAVRGIGREDLIKIREAIMRQRSEYTPTEEALFVDSLAAAGSSASLSVILELISKKEVSDIRATTLFMTMTNNIVNPDILPILVAFAKSQNMEEKPYFATMVQVNTASVIRRSCTDAKISQYSVPQNILGARRCNPSGVMKEYLSFLQQKLKQAQKPFERAVYAEALANLGSVQVLPDIKDIIAGHHGRNASIRVMGLYALLHFRMPDAPRNEIAKILTPIYENFNEDVQLRQTAILVQASWHPPQQFWTNLAVLSWTETSKEMGSFMYTLISTTSRSTNPRLIQQAEYAKLALESAKPYAPAIMRSFSYLWARLSPSYHLSTDFCFTKISTNESAIPREIFAYLYNANGGLDYTVIEQIGLSFNADELIFRAWEKLSPASWKSNPRKDNPKDYVDFLKIIKDELNFSGKTIYPYQLFYIMRLYDHIELFAPIDNDILSLLPKQGQSFIQTLLKGTKMEVVKYVNPGTIEMYFPLANALPVAYRLGYPIVSSMIGNVKLRIPNVPNPHNMDVFTAPEVKLELTKNAKFMSSYIANIAVIVPWMQNEIYTEIYMNTNYNDPSDVKLSLFRNISSDYVNSTVSWYSQASSDKAYPLSHKQNLPVVGIRSMWPSRQEQRVQKILVSPEHRTIENMRIPLPKSFHGVGGYIKYNADISYPYTMANLYDNLRNPQNFMRAFSKTSKRWDYEMVIDPAQSDTKSMNASISVWMPTTVLSLPRKNYTHVKEQNVDHTRDYPYGVSARVDFYGTVHRYFNASIGIAEVFDREYIKEYGIRMTVHRSALPGYSNERGAFCLNMTTSSPNFYNFPQLTQFLSQDRTVEAMIRGDMFLGDQCQQNKLGNFRGEMRMSSEEKKRIETVVNQHGDYTPFDALEPYYDRSKMVINYDNNKMSKLARNVSYMAYDTLRGMAFPHVSFAYSNVNNAPNQIRAEGSRLMKTNKWNGSIELPTESISFDSQRPPRHSYNVIPSSGIAPMSHECVIRGQNVKTFDEVNYKIHSANMKQCWTVAVINKKYPDRLQILTRKTSGYEVMIASSDRKMNIEVHASQIFVNGKALPVSDQARWVRDSKGIQFAQVVNQWDKTEVSIPGNVTVTVSDKQISIIPFKSLYGKVNGICGDFNTETAKEMIGPENCIYRNMTMFVQSWTTTNGPGCSKQSWNEAHSNVRKFQQTCAKAYPNVKQWGVMKGKECEAFVYPIVKEPHCLCVSTTSVTMCLPGCTEAKKVVTEEFYHCYLYNKIPAEVKPYISRGYVTVLPRSLPDIYQAILTEAAYICQ